MAVVFNLKGRFCQPRPKAWGWIGSAAMPQSLAKVYLHVVFSTKNRAPLLADDWRDELFHVLGGAANNLGCQSLLVGGVADHVHLLLTLSRTITIADAVGKIKSTSSLWVNQTRGLPTPFHWQAGYAAFSVSQSNVDAVKEYIRRQPEHHRKQSFQDELREWLRRYEVEWDERYMWDCRRMALSGPRRRPGCRIPRPSAWADRNDLSGRNPPQSSPLG